MTETTLKNLKIAAAGKSHAADFSAVPLRTYKDRVFRMIFKDKRNFLDLYNAMNDTAYGDPDDLTVTTLENAIYIGMKNDVSFLLYDQLAMYEHQSTQNPNLPVRNLFYVSSIYSDLTKHDNLYGARQIKIPEPVFVVFYNGKAKIPERSVLSLSDAYEHPSESPALELKVQVLNINHGYNRELMEKCSMLRDYSIFVSRVREYSALLPFPQAVEKAINTCISEGILKEFLQKNRAEVLNVSIFEYNEELHMQQERADAMAEGIREGMQTGETMKLIEQVKKKSSKKLTPEEIADALEEELPRVQEILAVIAKYPDADSSELYESLQKMKQKQ